MSLQNALEAEGLEVVQKFWPEWDRDAGEDVELVLRGLRYHEPSGKIPSLLWVISHPNLLKKEEASQYDLVYTTSSALREMIRSASGPEVKVLRQCTDTTKFTAPQNVSVEEDLKRRKDVIFVANLRGAQRTMAGWLAHAECPVSIFGAGWGYAENPMRPVREHIPNEELPSLYRAARLSLNDHWSDMRYFGMINNRIFDCLACGLPILSDVFPELRQVCGDDILYASDADDFRLKISRYDDDYQELLGKTRELWARIGENFTFGARAREIVQDLEVFGKHGSSPPLSQTLGAGENQETLTAATSAADSTNCAPAPAKSSEVIITGMHRSGTSFLTGALSLCGLYVGAEQDLTKPNSENPKGFFEHKELRGVTNGLLAQLGCDWAAVSGFSVSDLMAADIEDFRERIKRFRAQFPGDTTPIFKEPRLCLLLPVFLAELENPYVVFVHRDPVEVARSLRKRDGIPLHCGIALWEFYNHHAVKALKDVPHTVVRHKDLMLRPTETLAKLCRKLQKAGVANLRLPKTDELEQFHDAELYRERAEPAQSVMMLTPAQLALQDLIAHGDRFAVHVPPEVSGGTKTALCDLENFLQSKDRVDRLRARVRTLEKKLEAAEKELAQNTSVDTAARG